MKPLLMEQKLSIIVYIVCGYSVDYIFLSFGIMGFIVELYN